MQAYSGLMQAVFWTDANLFWPARRLFWPTISAEQLACLYDGIVLANTILPRAPFQLLRQFLQSSR